MTVTLALILNTKKSHAPENNGFCDYILTCPLQVLTKIRLRYTCSLALKNRFIGLQTNEQGREAKVAKYGSTILSSASFSTYITRFLEILTSHYIL